MKAIQRLPLNALRVFEAVARHGSMARAAEDLSVQPSAVSMHMKNLAGYLGTPLVVRQGTSIRLTAQGERLLPDVRAGLAQIDSAVVRLRQSARRRHFRVTVLPAFLQQWLLPRLHRFEAAHPSVRLKLVGERELVDIAGGQADAGIRLGDGRWTGLTSVHLMNECLLPVCSPAVAARVGWLPPGRVPESAPLLASDIDPWSRWTGEETVGRPPSIDHADVLSVLHAARAGAGVALVRGSLLLDDVEQGRLVVVGSPLPYRWSYHLVHPPTLAGDSTRQALQKWLGAECARHSRALDALTARQARPGARVTR